MPHDVHVTTPLIWICTSILALVDGIIILLVVKTISREVFHGIRWRLVIASGLFFFLVWVTVLWGGWDWFYSYIFPSWARYLLPPIFGIGYFALAFGMVWLSLKIPGSPAVTWCLLGGVEGLMSHIYAIYGLGAATKPPIMQGVDPLAVLVFAIFEKAFYWSIILLTCMVMWRWKNRVSGKVM